MNNVSVKFAFIMILTVFAGAYEVKSGQDATVSANKNTVKYVFLFIGDGMGDNHKILAEQAFQNGHPGARLFMTRLPVQARTITLNSEKKTTDSAAAGTAIACGVKTTNSKLGLDPAGNSLTSIAVIAKQKGMKVGMISTAALNDATPAAFYAHVDARDQFKTIVGDMAASGFDFFGGGKLHLGKSSEAEFAQTLKTAGYTILNGKSGLKSATTAKCYAQTPGYWVIDTKNPDVPTLAEYTLKASEVLDNPNGFFVMVEGGRIDHASHDNDAGAMIQELFAFDNAVKTGMEFQQKHPDDTLIVVTADHETGGLTLADDMQAQKAVILKQKASFFSILGDLKRIKNTEDNFEPAFSLVKEALGFDGFTKSEQADLKAVWTGDSKDKDKYKVFLSQAFKIRDLHCGVKWTTVGHSAAQITTAASGKGQELFAGNGENIAIFANLKQLISGCPP